MHTLGFIAGNTLLLGAAWQLSGVVARGHPLGERLVAALAGYPLLASAILLPLGIAGQLRWLPALAAAGALAAGTTVLRLAIPPPQEGKTEGETHGKLWLAAAAVLLAALIGRWGDQTLLMGTRFSLDDLNYHAPPVVGWLRDGRFTIPANGKYGYLPLGAEVFSLWWMLPYGDDSLAGCSGFWWGLLTAAALAALVRRQGGSAAAATCVAAAALAAPQMLQSATTFSSTDLAGPACLLAAAVLVCGAGRRPNWTAVTFAGACAGLAAGIKLHFVPAAAALALGYLGARQDRPWWKTGLVMLAFLASASLLGGYWYVRNWLLTGNPLYPAQLAWFPGWQTAAALRDTQLAHWLLARHLTSGQWFYLLSMHVNFPLATFLAAACGYGLACRASYTSEAAAPQASLLVAGVGLLLLALYPCMPYSATTEDTATLFINRRYLLAPLLSGLALLGPHIDFDGRRFAGLGLILLAILTGGWGAMRTGMDASQDALVATCMVLLLGAAQPLLRRGFRPDGRPRAALVAAGILGIVIGLALLQPLRARLTTRALFDLDAAQRAVNVLPPGSRLAYFGLDTYQYYPLFGRRYQLAPLDHHEDGTPRLPDYIEFARTRRDTRVLDEIPQPTVSGPSPVLARLREQGANYVLLSKASAGPWPVQREDLLHDTCVQRVYAEPTVEIWQVEPPLPPK